MQSFDRLVAIMARLRAPGGCLWDAAQTHQTLRAYLIEESAEVLEAIEKRDAPALCEELGDLLLQVVFHAQIADQNGDFSLEEVCEGISEKLIRRHPHVFGETKVENSAQVVANWETIKRAEKIARGETSTSILGETNDELPALSQSLQISKKAAKVGFEWPNQAEVLAKVHEEIAEIEAAIENEESNARIAEEIGDALFTLVNLARWRKIHPELALRDANHKFKARFQLIETEAQKRGLELEKLSPQMWDELWNAAKNVST